MADPTTVENKAAIDLLQQRLATLATVTQMDALQTLIASYRTSTDSSITTLEGRADNHDLRLNDLERRLQALE